MEAPEGERTHSLIVWLQLAAGRAATARNSESYSAIIDAATVIAKLEAYLALTEQIGSANEALALTSVVAVGFANDSSTALQTAAAC